MPVAIAEQDHVARQCRNRHVMRDDNNNIIGIFPDAFSLREGETSLSTTWLEFFGTSLESNRRSARDALVASGRTVKPRDALAIMNVGEIISAGKKQSIRLRVLHEPEINNPAHAAIRGIPREDQQILALLATEQVSSVIQVSDL